MSDTRLKAPSKALLWTEGLRAMRDFGLLPAALPLLHSAARGQGQPVMVLPGMAGGDRSTLALRLFLRHKGYAVYGWDQGRNVGARDLLMPLQARIESIQRKHAGPVSLVGWSLGGIYARELAKRVAERVRCVITLGSPFKGPAKASNVWRLYELLSGRSVEERGDDHALERTPSVPTTAIFTRADGIVAWQRCIETPGERVESIEVAGSHFGLGHNALALYAIADRLAQDPDNWRPFAPHGKRRLCYRDPWRDQAV